MNDLKKYPHPYVTVDVVLFSIINGKLNVLLSQRDEEPFNNGEYTIPGTFIHEKESAEGAVLRLIDTKLGLSEDFNMKQVEAFSDPFRDPRDRVISICFYGIVPNPENLAPTWAKWFEISRTASGLYYKSDESFLEDTLGFDHAKMINAALNELQEDSENIYKKTVFQFLPDKENFTAQNLNDIMAAILFDKSRAELLNRGNFKKYILNRYEELNIITKVGKTKPNGKGRPADTYKFNKGRY